MTERVDQMLSVLPRGNSLDDHAWDRRHRLLLWLCAAHVPVLLVAGVLLERTSLVLLVGLLPPVLGLGIGLLLPSRLVRSTAVTLGLVGSASTLVYFTGGLPEAHFHYFVLLGFIALYQDWRPYLVAVAYLVVGHGLVAVLMPEALYNSAIAQSRPWMWAAMNGAFVLAACVAHVLFWKHTERQQYAAESYYAKLYEGERAVVARLRQTQTVKDELIAVVGHEFRTPLTSIQGFARTLDARFDRMDRDSAQVCTQAIEREAKRLTRMVANLLTASEDVTPGPDDRCVLPVVAQAVVADVAEVTPLANRNIGVYIAADEAVAMAPDTVHQLLFNLLDNAVKFAEAESDVRLATRRDENQVVLEITNVGPPIDGKDRERIFDAFVQADSSDTRRYGGMGLGLHIARRIVSAYGGRIGVYCEGPVVIFRAWLPAAPPAAGGGATTVAVSSLAV